MNNKKLTLNKTLETAFCSIFMIVFQGISGSFFCFVKHWIEISGNGPFKGFFPYLEQTFSYFLNLANGKFLLTQIFELSLDSGSIH